MTLTNKPLVLKNYQLGPMVKFLSLPLPGQAARARNRFILAFNKQITAIEDRRLALLKQHGDLDDKGELQIDTASGNFKLKDKEAFHKDYDALMREEYAAPCVGNALVDFRGAYGILKDLPTQLSVEETTIYDEIMTAFEAWAGDTE